MFIEKYLFYMQEELLSFPSLLLFSPLNPIFENCGKHTPLPSYMASDTC